MKEKEYVLSLSYGKDSLACLGAIKELGWPLDRIIHAEIWATDDIPADLPPMIEFKSKADAWILENFGIEVEHVCAMTTFERTFYRKFASGSKTGEIYGFPMVRGAWCNDRLKTAALDATKKVTYEDIFYTTNKSGKREGQIYGWPFRECSMVQRDSEISRSAERSERRERERVSYVGIALDEPKRLARLDGVTKISPLAAIGWTEEDAKQWCIENDLLSPIYTTSTRGGCWFCHNQSVDQLRILRKTYPELWAIMLKWDADSPVSFKPNGHTVHDFDRRFELEDSGLLVPGDKRFKWRMLDELESKQESG